MSTIIVVAPLIIANWPVITAAVTAAVSSLGFSIVRSASTEGTTVRAQTKTKAEIEVENSEILEAGGTALEQLVVEKEGIKATFSRDARGALKLCMEGQGHTKAELQRVGKELLDRVTQQYVYHRVVTELKERNMTVVDEEVSQDRTVKIRVRNL